MKQLLTLLLGLVLASAVMAANPSIVDRANLDTTVSPCANFWEYANGTWIKTHEIPAIYPSWSLGLEMHERNQDVIHNILNDAVAKTDAPKGSPTQKIGDFFATAMDTAKIEADGYGPIKADLAKIDALKSTKDLQALITEFHAQGGDYLFGFGPEQDLKNSSQVIAYATQGGLGLPDRDYYTKEDPESQALRDKYVAHVANMLKLLGDDDATAKAEADKVMAMETRLAKASLTNVEQRDPATWYNPTAVADADRATPHWSWTAYVKDLGAPPITSFSYAHPKFFAAMDSMLTELPMADWQAYMKWHLVHQSAPYLSSAFVNENFDFYAKTLSGTRQLQPRWRRALRATESAMGEVLGQLYVEKTFPPRAKQKALELVDNLLAAMKDRINSLAWMSPETKTLALKKLSTFTRKIGYPDKWRDYSALQIEKDSYLANVRRGRTFELRRQLAKIGKPVDRTEWGMYPQTLNAYYNPLQNEIVFPAAILQPPLFDPDADDASNYGAIGSVIGHEITHGFDDQGAKFDEQGNMKNWWASADSAEFARRTDVVVAQYAAYTPVDTVHINGQLTLGENIADIGGLKVAYYALQKALAAKPQTPIDGFTPEQRFFLAFAAGWRDKVRPEAVKLQINTDPHSPAEYRVRGPLANMPEFEKAFGCTADSPMMRKEADRVNIW